MMFERKYAKTVSGVMMIEAKSKQEAIDLFDSGEYDVDDIDSEDYFELGEVVEEIR